MKKYKVGINAEECISCGACETNCPENWEVPEGEKAKFKKEMIEESEFAKNKDAVDNCPVSCMTLEEVPEGTPE